MSKRLYLIVLIGAATLLSSCRFNRSGNGKDPAAESPAPAVTVSPTDAQEPQAQTLQYATGRNDYIIDVDNTPREVIVHVPGGYDSNSPTPVVFMIHGSNQSGNVMYENTNWVAIAERENIIVVYPTGWKYRLVGEGGLHEKWNTPGTAQAVEPGTELKDDVKFIRAIVENLKATFNVDEKRIFASGFSNGGGFVLTRLIPDMNDVFAAYSTGGSGLIGEGTASDVPVQVSVSLYSVLGTNDNKIAENQELATPFPIAEEEIVNDPIFGGMLDKTLTLLALEDVYTVETSRDFTRFTFANSPSGSGNEYVFMMIRGIGHVYPSGDNNRAGVDAAELFWEFFLRHAKP